MVWVNGPVVVYHGTDEISARNIQNNGIQLALCRPAADFGRGFYVTSNLHQAEQWANQKMGHLPQGSAARLAAVLTFDLDRDAAADLDDHLTFVIADPAFHDFVIYNRLGGPHHHRNIGVGYDLVYGPVAAYPQTITYANCDQICFLNQRALGGLTIRSGTPAYGNPLF
jgi:Protein of unknown function (DUF3990)